MTDWIRRPKLGAACKRFGFLGRRPCHRLQNGAYLLLILDQNDPVRFAVRGAAVVDQGIAADLANPGIERRLAAIAIEILDRVAQRLLGDFQRSVVIATEARHRETGTAAGKNRRTGYETRSRHP